MKKLKFLTIALATMLMCGHIQNMDAQVTIGSAIAPEKAALLDLKTKEALDLGGENADAGFLLPRVQLTNRKTLDPLLSSVGMTADAYVAEMQAHAGLMVYNVSAVSAEKLNSGVNIWNGSEWTSLIAGTLGISDYALAECSSIKVNEPNAYKVGAPLNGDQSLLVSVNVIEAGTYEIVAKPDVANGYYFSASGTFHEAGNNIVVEMKGTGTPTKETTGAGDKIVITLNNQASGCNQTFITVNPASKPLYTFDCTGGVVSGKFQVGVKPDVTYTMPISVEVGAEGALAVIETDVVDNVRFRASFNLPAAGQHEIKLYAESVGDKFPTNSNTKTFTINYNNSESTTPIPLNCSFMVSGLSKPLSIMGAASESQDMVAETNPDRSGISLYRMLVSLSNYGPEGTIKVDGKLNVLQTRSMKDVTTPLSANPDVIITSRGIKIGATDAAKVVDYVKNGGVFLLYSDVHKPNTSEGAPLSNIVKAFGINATVSEITDSEINQNLTEEAKPILQGSFGAPTKWTRPSHTPRGSVMHMPVMTVPTNQDGLTILSKYKDGRISAFMYQIPGNANKGIFIYFGTAVFNRATSVASSDGGQGQFLVTNKITGQPANDNARITANLIAWIIQQKGMTK